MAAFNFPNSPSTNDTHTENSVTWKWDGTVWKRQGVAGAQGAVGAQGAAGAVGAQGAAGSATISNNADNRVITGGSGTNLNGEATLTYDGSDLIQTIGASNKGIKLTAAGSHYPSIIFDSNRTTENHGIMWIDGKWNGTSVGALSIEAGDDTTNKDDGKITFYTTQGGSMTRKMAIEQDGNVYIDSGNLEIKANVGDMLRLDRNNTGAVGNQIAFRHSASGTLTETGSINCVSTANAATGELRFYTKASGGSNTERLRITSAGKLGLGVASPSTTLHLDSTGATTTIQIDSDTESSIDFNDHGGSAKRYKIGTNISDNSGQFEIKDMTANAERLRIDSNGMSKFTRGSGGTVGHFYANARESNILIQNDARTWKIVNYDYGNNGSDNLGFHDGTADRMIIQNDGSVKIGDGDLIIGTSGHGINFSATSDGAGTDSSELFDDYEEGSWTPVLAFANYSISSQSNNGTYVKIGNMCHCEFHISVNSANISGSPSSGGWVRINGIPYNSSSSAGYQYIGNPTACGKLKQYVGTNGSNDFNKIFFYMPGNVSYCALGANKDPQTTIGTDYLYGLSEETWAGAVNDSGNHNTEVRGSFSYRTI